MSIYHLYDLNHALFTPARLMAGFLKNTLKNPAYPMADSQIARTIAASAEVFERMHQKFERPTFDLHSTTINGKHVHVTEDIVDVRPFCRLRRFVRDVKRNDPRVLIVAPMSGHYATLLRGTVDALLPHHDVYITDWEDAKMVPRPAGRFNLDDYIDYVIDYIDMLGPDVHVIAVCQPAVPVMAAAAIMNNENYKTAPRTMTLMGGPIDARVSPTDVNELAEKKPLSWFERNLVSDVPAYYPGAFRRVYPGFLQLAGFMSMNLDRHTKAHMDFFKHLIQGDGESAQQHRKFYDEYLAVMDLSAEFYLQTVDIVFQRYLLPQGLMKWKDPATDELHDVLPAKIKRTALLTIEGELDDISAHGQTTAAHVICTGLPADMQFHHFQESVGHYGIFNGRRWREKIMPRIRHFIREFDQSKPDPIPAADLAKIPDIAPTQYDKKKHSIEAVRARTQKEEY